MKTQLERLYRENYEQIKKVREKYKEYDLGGPFLISPSENYSKKKRKLFIVGQQTNGWCCNIDDVQKQMRCYEDFNLGENYSRSPFWNVFHKIERRILNDEYCSAWGNFNRFDLEGDKPSCEIEKEISTLDYLLLEEIKILKPDICLFLVGYSFDSRIKNLFPDVSFEEVGRWKINQLAKIKHPDLPDYTYRTYNPPYLRRGKLEEPFLKELKNEIR